VLPRPLGLVTNDLGLVQQENEPSPTLLHGHLDNLKERFGDVLPLLFDQRVIGHLEFFPAHAESSRVSDSATNGLLDPLNARQAQL
jgi:hypothetical protein